MNNERKKATALKYDENIDAVPIVTAIGKGLIAETIIDKAKEENVPIVEDPTLVSLLQELNINEAIPEELYEAVAEVFAFIYHADKKLSEE
ncbi:EscU/YscU/HrcU family type III secretion system export apparatus switch protein [Oceanobacillus bengalensis]|uniref:EscU/YscU/HrcU family type III secretion system export apparatus switch protein n=1 Tax=Oceanobacillus bengalensis TaxID=1435466 RepID=A0A494Z4C3_9BACI|nr:EscU/YscU/HrcU family type III secretion system export apparatus switch protein [Oceanobacillus bengalensis]RKQ17386.1 hypothetical protein D8M05_04980 [Oceanobacillus bengalensis]